MNNSKAMCRRVPTRLQPPSSSLSCSFDGLAKAPERGRRTDEKVVRKCSIAKDFVVDAIAVVQIRAQPRQKLETQVAIAVDLRICGPARKLPGAAGIIRKQIVGTVHPDLAERTRHRRKGRC